MSISEIILIGVALSMDAFAVSLSSGMMYSGLTRKQKISMPLAFGLFQGIMPIIGYFLGSLFSDFITKWDGPIALVILGFIGINMIKYGLTADEAKEPKRLTIQTLLLQAVATSIDAFAVGVTFAAGGADIFTAAPIVAVTTFTLSLIAVIIGEKVGEKLGDRAEIIGGIILIIIGIKSMF